MGRGPDTGDAMSATRKLREGENFFSWLLLVFSVAVLFLAYRISGFKSVSSPGAFPMFAAAVMVLAMIGVLLNNRRMAKPETDGLQAELVIAAKSNFPQVVLIFIAIIIAYMFILQPLTFLPSSFAFLFFSTWYLRGSSLLKAFLVSLLTLGGIYVIFHTAFKVVLP
jgi:putative tricarboxylic transport membrane protein